MLIVRHIKFAQVRCRRPRASRSAATSDARAERKRTLRMRVRLSQLVYVGGVVVLVGRMRVVLLVMPGERVKELRLRLLIIV